MTPFIHATSDVKSSNVGMGTRIWQYVVVLDGAEIGRDCNICSHCLIERDVVVGDRVTIKSGVQLWDGVRLENDVFVGPNVAFTNDMFPRSKVYPDSFRRTVVRQGASIGANATILPGLTIGAHAMIGAGAVVTKNVPANAIVVGNPGVISGYVSSDFSASAPAVRSSSESGVTSDDLKIGGCRLYKLPSFQDLRGSLSVTEFEKDLPFVVKRCFWVHGVPTQEVRGEHAHRECHQFLVCVSGQVTALLDDGYSRTEVVLSGPSMGLHIPPGVWGVQYKYSHDAVLVVMASHVYAASDYIRDYDEFLNFKEIKGEA